MRHFIGKPTFHTTLTPDQLYVNVTTLGNRVYARARSAEGRSSFAEIAYEPTYYLPSNTYSGITNPDGRPLVPHSVESIYAGKQFLDQHPEAYGNIGCEYQLLSDVYGSQDIPVDMDRLYIAHLDIEVASDTAFAPVEDPFNEVTAITVIWRHMGQRGIIVYGLKPYTVQGDEEYILCDSEEELLRTFHRDWRGGGDYPDIVTGWNIQFYDMPYLVNRMRRLFGDEFTNRMSPYERLADRRVTLNGKDQSVVDIRGIAILDYLELYRKFTYTQQESYRLDHIAHIELGERKLSYSEFQSLSELYHKDYQKFIAYNIRDVELVEKLDAKLKFIELVATLTYSAKANYVDTFRQVRMWDIMIYHYLRARNVQVPPKIETEKTEQYAGGYVKDPQIGQHAWVVSFDVASMYPHIIREWNLSPETLIGTRHEHLTVEGLLQQSFDLDALRAGEDVCIAANGIRTIRDTEGFLPQMIRSLYDERVKYKSLAKQATKTRETLSKDDPEYANLTRQIAAYNARQMALKIQLNSLYGATGSQYFRFYNTHMAEAVTITGQYVIQWVAQSVNRFLNRMFGSHSFGSMGEDFIVASDTDSIYVRLGKLIDLYQAKQLKTVDQSACIDVVNQFCQTKIEPVIATALQELADYMNVATPCLSMAREVIADKGVWVAKKHYALNCLDVEGIKYPSGKMKIMGISAVKSSTPSVVRKMLREALRLLLTGTEQMIWNHVQRSWKTFELSPFEDVAWPRSVNGLSDYELGEKGIPIHVRGALVYNRLIEAHPTYEPIRNGQKIKFAYLKTPNKFFTNVISTPGGCPKEWEIDTLIDYQMQWSKSFLDPLNDILNKVGWHTERVDTLF